MLRWRLYLEDEAVTDILQSDISSYSERKAKPYGIERTALDQLRELHAAADFGGIVLSSDATFARARIPRHLLLPMAEALESPECPPSWTGIEDIHEVAAPCDCQRHAVLRQLKEALT